MSYFEWDEVSTGEQDYSDYIKYLSNMGNMFSFLTGFMFTAITVLVTRLPNPNSVVAQIALFFMATMLDVFIFLHGQLLPKSTLFLQKHPTAFWKKEPL